MADSRVIATGEANDLFSMCLLYKSVFLKTALDTDYESGYVHIDDRRGYSISRATRIQEIEEYGAPAQHCRSPKYRFASLKQPLPRNSDGGDLPDEDAMRVAHQDS